MKRSLQWFGFIQAEEDSDSELDRELHTTNGDFEFLPGADKEHEGQANETGKGDKVSKHPDDEYSKLYPDLRDYLDSLNAKQASEVKFIPKEIYTYNTKRHVHEDLPEGDYALPFFNLQAAVLFARYSENKDYAPNQQRDC